MRKKPSMRSEIFDKPAQPAARRSAGAILDGSLGFVLLILTTALLAMIRNGFQPEVLLIALAYAALMLLVARRHGWRMRDYIGRLRGAPFGGDGDGPQR
jgi:uncharacterized membrane protein